MNPPGENEPAPVVFTVTRCATTDLMYIHFLGSHCPERSRVGRGNLETSYSETPVPLLWILLRAFFRHQSEQMKIINNSLHPVGIESTAFRVYSHTLVPLCHDDLNSCTYMTI